MAEREQIKKPSPKETKESLDQLAEDDAAVQEAQEKEAVDLSDLDDFLDWVDSILEEQEVLTNYRQRGGE